LRRYEEAIRAFRRALRLQPAHEEARYYLGLCYVRKGAYDRALMHFEPAHRQAPTVSVRLLFAMAQCYNGLEMPRQAVRLLQQLVDLVPDHARASHLLGICYDKLGERERAGDAYRRSDLHLTLARGRRAAGRVEGRP
jgi:tetratricopeptide (TPR) repeat protein